MPRRAEYDDIGRTYTATRREDPRIAAAVWAALGDAKTVLNVGAGAGAYEPHDRHVLALDPSEVMIAQRPEGAAPVMRYQLAKFANAVPARRFVVVPPKTMMLPGAPGTPSRMRGFTA